MGFSTGNGGFSSRGGRFRGTAPMSEMNVVPLVDVVLVLLIIFMLTAHVMEFGLEIEVPKVTQVRDTTEDFPVVSITRSGDLYLNENGVNINDLGLQVREQFGDAQAVYVRADRLATFEVFAVVADALRKAQLEVRVVTQPQEDTREQR
jgi:biopolymer transport protein ExbD